MKDRPNVLLIEDSDDDAFFFRRALMKACPDCEFSHAADGGAAVELLRRAASGLGKTPDLIYLDLKMPVLNGFEVLDWIRQQPVALGSRLTVLSGSDQEKDRRRAESLGAARYLVKPVKVEHLLEDFSALQDRTDSKGPRRNIQEHRTA